MVKNLIQILQEIGFERICNMPNEQDFKTLPCYGITCDCCPFGSEEQFKTTMNKLKNMA